MKKAGPCSTQDQAQVENYYRYIKAGDKAVIRATQGNMLCYHLAKVIETKNGRVYFERGYPWGGERWYMKSGKSCDHPTGQSNLVMPTPEVLSELRSTRAGTQSSRRNKFIRRPGSAKAIRPDTGSASLIASFTT